MPHPHHAHLTNHQEEEPQERHTLMSDNAQPTLTTRGQDEYATLAHVRGVSHDVTKCTICSVQTELGSWVVSWLDENRNRLEVQAKLREMTEAFNLSIAGVKPQVVAVVSPVPVPLSTQN